MRTAGFPRIELAPPAQNVVPQQRHFPTDLKLTVTSVVNKLALDYGARTIIEIAPEGRLSIALGIGTHTVVSPAQLPLADSELNGALVVADRQSLGSQALSHLSEHALLMVITEDLNHADLDPSLPILFEGTCPTFREILGERSRIWILDRSAHMLQDPVPEHFQPVSLMTTFNDVDVIDAVIDHTLAQGLKIVIMDNWSTDGTYERLLARRRELFRLERFPPEGPSPTFDSMRILNRQEDIAATLAGQWVTIQASDELRESPWMGVSMRQALYYAERRGANCVEFTVAEFRPVDDSFREGADLETALPYFEFGRPESCLVQQKTWKQPETKVEIAATGGHAVFFEGKTLFPYKFLLKHYSIRSQEHGERKVFGLRKNRWNRHERETLGWHTHYDSMQPGYSFLRRPEELIRYDPTSFFRDLLVERISGIGTVTGMDWWVAVKPKLPDAVPA